MAFWYGDTPQWSRMISSLCERFYGFRFLLRGFPDCSIDPWCPFALVFSPSFHSKSFAAKGVGQHVLQRLDLAPLALLLSLYDTHLKPPHLLVSCLPINGMPAPFLVGSCTSSLYFCRHLHCLLCRLVKFSRKERKTRWKFARFRVESIASPILPMTGGLLLVPSSSVRSLIRDPCGSLSR